MGAEAVLVGLAAAEKMELARALERRFPDRGQHGDASGTVPRPLGIEAADVETTHSAALQSEQRSYRAGASLEGLDTNSKACAP